MKARLKGTDFTVDVTPYYSNGQFMGYQDTAAPPGVLLYEPERLDFISEPDWDAYRREAAKDLLPFAAELRDHIGKPEVFVKTAIELADELIRQLKED